MGAMTFGEHLAAVREMVSDRASDRLSDAVWLMRDRYWDIITGTSSEPAHVVTRWRAHFMALRMELAMRGIVA